MAFASDVQVSMPEGWKRSDGEKAAMFGWVFTENGLRADLTDDQAREVATPKWSPSRGFGGEIRGDRDMTLGIDG